jgi:nucleolar complex protein 3
VCIHKLSLTRGPLNSFRRSKYETDRLHKLSRPIIPKRAIDDDLPSVDSHDDDDGEPWSSGIDDDESPSEDEGDSFLDDSKHQLSDSDVEMAYEKIPRKKKVSWDDEKKSGIQRLPIKLPDGRIQETGRIAVPPSDIDSDSSSGDSSLDDDEGETRKVEDVSTGARFGRPSVVDVVGTKSRIARIQAAKEQIAGICQEILADPENSVSVLAEN